MTANGLNGTTTVDIFHNKSKEGIEIDFLGKVPVKVVRDWLKRNCFQFSGATKRWYIPYTADRLENILFIFKNRSFETEDFEPKNKIETQNQSKTTTKLQQKESISTAKKQQNKAISRGGKQGKLAIQQHNPIFTKKIDSIDSFIDYLKKNKTVWVVIKGESQIIKGVFKSVIQDILTISFPEMGKYNESNYTLWQKSSWAFYSDKVTVGNHSFYYEKPTLNKAKKEIEIEVEKKKTTKTSKPIYTAKTTKNIDKTSFQNLVAKAKFYGAISKETTNTIVFHFDKKKDLDTFIESKELTLLQKLQAFIPKYEDFDYKLSYNAHRNTSFDPEKRAKQNIEGQIKDLENFAQEINNIKSKNENYPIIASFERFVKSYLEKEVGLNSSRSGMASTMITGRGNFPVARQQKISNAYHKKLDAFLEWFNKTKESILNNFNQRFIDQKPIVVGESDSLQKLEEKLKKLEERQEMMLLINKILRKKISWEEKEALLKENKIKDELIQSVKNDSIPSFMTTNNRANINRVKEQITTHKKEEKRREIAQDIYFEGGYITENATENRLQIMFDGKPSPEIIKELKSHGLRWSPKNKAWQRQLTENARYSIYRLLLPKLGGKKKVDAVTEPEPKGTEAQQNVLSVPLTKIFTNKSLFQNRENDYSEESTNRIIHAVDLNKFNWAVFDPILLWKSTEDGKLYVLSGHSRFNAFKKLAQKKVGYMGKNFTSIPAKIIETDKENAIKIALESNTLSTKETDLERANYYRKLREKGKGKTEILNLAKDNEGKNAPKIINLSHLNPTGEMVSLVNNFSDSDTTNKATLEIIATWIGEARAKFSELTNSHENELSKWLILSAYGTKIGQFTNKKAFFERLNVAIQRKTTFGKFDSNTPLNMEKAVFKNNIEQDFDNVTQELKKVVSEAEKDLKKVSDNAYLSLKEGKTTQKRVNEVVAEKTKFFTIAKNNLQAHLMDKNNVLQASKQQASLFGTKKIFSASEISKMKFKEYPFTGQYLALMGKPTEGFRMMLHGRPGGGKTTFLLQFSKYLCNNFGNVLYISKEEFGSSTLANKLQKIRPLPHNLEFTGDLEDVQLSNYDFVVLDSINDLGLDLKAFKELKKANPTTSFILILQSTKNGQFRGGREWEHEVEIGAEIKEQGQIEVYKNRFDVLGKMKFF